MRRLAAIVAIAAQAGACALPVISFPVGSLTGGDEVRTASIPANGDSEVHDEGVADRIGSGVWEALRRAVASAAELAEDGRSFAWKSDQTGMQGTVTAVDAFFDADGAVCRRLSITATAYQRVDTFLADACRGESGAWSLKPRDGNL